MATKLERALKASDDIDRAWHLIDKARDIVCKSSDRLGAIGYSEAVGRLNALACIMDLCLDMAGDMSDMRDVLNASIRRDTLLNGANPVEDMPERLRGCDDGT